MFSNNDNKRIRDELERWVPLSYTSIITEHKIRADAFLSCCHPMDTIDGNKLKIYVDNYGLLDEQEKIIEKCILKYNMFKKYLIIKIYF